MHHPSSWTHLAVHRWRSEAELLDESHEGTLQDPTQVLGGLWGRRVVPLLSFLLRHHRAVIWRGCRATGPGESQRRRGTEQQHRLQVLTLRLLWDGHAQPLQVYAVLAADAGGPAAKGVEGDSADDEREF